MQDDVMDKTLLSSSPTKDPKKLELLVQFTLWPREWGSWHILFPFITF